MFGLSGEHLLILAAVLLIFGPRKLPELGASIGKALKNFKEGLNGPSSAGKLDARNAPPVNNQASSAPTATPVAPAESEAPKPASPSV